MTAHPLVEPFTTSRGLSVRFNQKSATLIVLLLQAFAFFNTSQAADTRSLEHAFGEVTIQGTPERIITLYQGATDTAVALGIKPVGVVDSWIQRPMYRYLRDTLEGVHHVGKETQPNLEDISWLQPDLIFATSYRHEQVRDLLTSIAPTVAQESVFDFKETLRLMGQATGRETEARVLLRAWECRVADFKQRVEWSMGDEWPQEVAVAAFKSDHARIYYTGFAGSILNELGFRRPASHRKEGWGIKLTNMETIPAMNADVIFFFMDSADPAVVSNFRRWQAHPLWQTLDAVQHDRINQVDPVTWSMGAGILAANALLDDLYAHYDLPTGENTQENRPRPVNKSAEPCQPSAPEHTNNGGLRE